MKIFKPNLLFDLDPRHVLSRLRQDMNRCQEQLSCIYFSLYPIARPVEINPFQSLNALILADRLEDLRREVERVHIQIENLQCTLFKADDEEELP